MIETSAPAPASAVSHVDALPPGTRLAEFEILALLGVGGFGMVYKAFDHSLHRAVAIKEYMPSALAGRAQGQSLWVRSSSDQQTFHAGLESFVGEARLLAQFDHPSLVKVFRFWEANNTAYMVMPLYSGMTFKQARAQMRTPPTEEWLRKLLWSVLGALRVLHDGKTLHRDISPDNIFLQDSGPPVLLDLGAARHAINDKDHKHTAVLKVNYAPIEQYSEGDEDLRQGPWSDLYSLGAVVHGCLCNDTPLPATLRSIKDRMVPFSRVAKTVKKQLGVEYSPAFVAAVSQALSLKPEDRPQSIDAFLQLMEMTAPPEGVDHFDFRADLGDIWVEPADQPGPGLLTPTVDVTAAPAIVAEIAAQANKAMEAAGEDAAADGYPDTVQRGGADTVFMDPADTEVLVTADHDRKATRHGRGEASGAAGRVRAALTESERAAAALAARADRRPGRMPVWLVLGAAGLAVAAAGVWWSQGRGPKAAPADDIITEMAEPAPAASEAAAVLVPASEPALVVASAPADAAPGAADAASAAAVAKPAPKPKRAVASEPAPAPVVAHEEPPPPPPPPPPVERPRPAPVRVPSPQEACADASFLTRPMCIHNECQKPSQANSAICVENKRRYDAEEARRRQSP
ncbi:serine/threonine protein kinase [Acidovorax sp. LjRoot118]|uniref:serine/threonine protein kinase n=1 Tax=unclassified Acidovorax TaxID=2684926 RepID=UPI00070CEFDC|nr:serine/threonine-protein kinase [Acidovorax sp. Root219]KRC19600.1 serine/threonine protein kinase [Acidovorax sp. Root219]